MTSWSIHHGNCLDWIQALPDRSVDHVITDPPYEAEAHTLQRRSRIRGVVQSEPISFAPISSDCRINIAQQVARVVTRWVIIFCQVEAVSAWRDAFDKTSCRYVRAGVWIKPNPQPQYTGDRPGMGYETLVFFHQTGRCKWNGSGRSGVFFSRPRTGAWVSIHPTQKPLDLMLELVELFTDPGELIIDPFAGVATTGVAAVRLGRRFLGCELDAHWAEVGRERLAAEQLDSSLPALRRGQLALFGCSTSIT